MPSPATCFARHSILLSKQELTDLFGFFDTDGAGNITYEELLEGVRGPMSKKRLGLVMQALEVIDKDGNGALEPGEVIDAFDAANHPDVLSGKREQDEVSGSVSRSDELRRQVFMATLTPFLTSSMPSPIRPTPIVAGPG